MKKTLLIILTLAFLVSLPASAALLELEEEYSLNRDETISDNLYVGSGDILISGNVFGDFVAAGGNILINGRISKDLTIAGGSINILGEIGDDLRAIGGQVVINNNVKGDVVIAGGNVNILSGARIGGDVVVAGGRVSIDGTVNGDIKAAGGKLVINGTVLGNVQAGLLNKFRIGRNAVINGNVSYNSPLKANIEDGATIRGDVIFNQTNRPSFGIDAKDARKTALAFIGVLALLKFLAVLGAGIISVLVFKNKSKDLVNNSLPHFWAELLRGLVVLIVAPVIIIILLLSVVGSLFGLLGMLVVASFLLVARIYAGIILGGWLYKVFSKSKSVKVSWDSALIGIVILQLVGYIPIVGWITSLVFFTVAFGSISHLFYKNFWLKNR